MFTACAAVRFGKACSSSAIAPATWGAANEVPDTRSQVSLASQLAARFWPGATRKLFSVLPAWFEKVAMVEPAGATVLVLAPTATIKPPNCACEASCAGNSGFGAGAPAFESLPAEMVTAMPALVASSSACCRPGLLGDGLPSERLITRAPFWIANSMPFARSASVKPKFFINCVWVGGLYVLQLLAAVPTVQLSARIESTVELKATPMVPKPLNRAAS